MRDSRPTPLLFHQAAGGFFPELTYLALIVGLTGGGVIVAGVIGVGGGAIALGVGVAICAGVMPH